MLSPPCRAANDCPLMARRLRTITTLSGEFPLNGFELPADVTGFIGMVEDFRRDFPAGIELLVAVMSFQKIHSLRA